MNHDMHRYLMQFLDKRSGLALRACNRYLRCVVDEDEDWWKRIFGVPRNRVIEWAFALGYVKCRIAVVCASKKRKRSSGSDVQQSRKALDWMRNRRLMYCWREPERYIPPCSELHYLKLLQLHLHCMMDEPHRCETFRFMHTSIFISAKIGDGHYILSPDKI